MGCYYSTDLKNEEPVFPEFKNLKFQYEVVSAIIKNSIPDISELIPSKFDINFRMPSFNYRTALHIAAEHGNSETVKYLIKLGADVNLLDQYHTPPIFLALSKGDLESVQLIYYSSSSIKIKTRTTHNLYFHDFIKKDKHAESVHLLSSFGYKHPDFIKGLIRTNERN